MNALTLIWVMPRIKVMLFVQDSLVYLLLYQSWIPYMAMKFISSILNNDCTTTYFEPFATYSIAYDMYRNKK